MTTIDFQVTWSKVKVKLFVLILSVVYSVSYDLLISIDIKKVKLWIKVKLLTANHTIKFCLLKNHRLFCHQNKQKRLSPTSDFLNHWLETSLQYATLLNFAPGGHLYFSKISWYSFYIFFSLLSSLCCFCGFTTNLTPEQALISV